MHYLSKLCLFKVSLQLNSTWPDPLPDISLIPDMIQFWKIIWYHSIYPVNVCLVEGVRARNIPSTSVCDYSMYLLSTSACLCGRFIFPQDPSSPQILGRRRPHLDKYKSRHSAASLSNSFPHIRSAWTLPHTRLHVQLYSVHSTQVRCMPRMGGDWEIHNCPKHEKYLFPGISGCIFAPYLVPVNPRVQRVQNMYGKGG